MDRIVRFFLRKAFCILSLFVVSVLITPLLSQAADVSEINAKLDALQREVSELKANSVAKDNVVTRGEIKGSYKIPGTNTSIAIGGFVKGSVIWSSVSSGSNSIGDQATVPNMVPVGPDAGKNERSQVNFNARQSMLWFDTSSPSAYGTVSTHFDGDFFAPQLAGNETLTNSHGFRIRQGYGSIGSFTLGQFFTTSTSWNAYPEFIDFSGPVSIIASRQVGARWTQKFEGGAFSVAVENPETFLAGVTPASLSTPDDDKFPDVHGKVTFNVGKCAFDVSGVVRFLRIDAPENVDSKTGWGVVLSGNIPVFGKDDFKFQVSRGDGFGRYIGMNATFGDGVLINGKIETITTTAGFVSYRHFWTPTVRSTLILSTMKATDPPNSPTTITNRASSVHLNMLWSPVPRVQIGPEYMYIERRIESGLSGHLNRVQFSARYDFF